MLFSEFTKAIKEERYPFYTSQRENGISRLYKQYEIIEALYMESGSMSKEEAYKVWRNTFGKEHKQIEQKHNDLFDTLTADQLSVSDNNYLCRMAMKVRDSYPRIYVDGMFEFTVEVTHTFPNGNQYECVFVKNLLTKEKRQTVRNNWNGHGFYQIETA